MLTKNKFKDKETLFLVKDGNKPIGRYDSGRKLFFYFTNQIFRKYNGFGINVKLLNNPEFELEKVWVFLKNDKVEEVYETQIKNFYDAFEKGKDIYEDKNFTRVYVRLPLWKGLKTLN